MLISKHAEEIEKKLSDYGLSKYAEAVKATSFSCIDLIGSAEEDYSELGNSRFAGDPDIPVNCSWQDEVSDKVFLFQFSFSDQPLSFDLGLPKEGLLYVFSSQEGDYGSTYFESCSKSDLVRFSMPEPKPDYIFSSMKCWKLRAEIAYELPEYGSSVYEDLSEAGLADSFDSILADEARSNSGDKSSQQGTFCQIAGKFEELNGDLRERAAESFGGIPTEWRSLWKVFSSFKSGLVIGDCNTMHGMIRSAELSRLDFSKVFSIVDVC